MPQQQHYYEPDAVDCYHLVAALGEDFGCVPEVETIYSLDRVEVRVRVHKLGQPGGDAVQVQARITRPLRQCRNLFVMQYSALLDCWHQLDRGVLGVARAPAVFGWNGRPETPRRRKS